MRRWLKKLVVPISSEIDMIGPRVKSLLMLNPFALSSLTAAGWLAPVWWSFSTIDCYIIQIADRYRTRTSFRNFSAQWVFKRCNCLTSCLECEMGYLIDLILNFKSGIFFIVSLLILSLYEQVHTLYHIKWTATLQGSQGLQQWPLPTLLGDIFLKSCSWLPHFKQI